MILRDATLFRTLHHVPAGSRARVLATIEAIEQEWPNLPGTTDTEYVAPPGGARWRRRVAGTAWWVLYTYVPESQTLILRTVNILTE